MYANRARTYASLTLLCVIAGLSGCESTVYPPPPPDQALTQFDIPSDPKVIIFVIDGARRSETFADTSHAYIPHIWNDLRPQGTLLSSFHNQGITATVPGHSSMITGTWQNLANDGTERPTQPTIFEYYRKTHSVPQSDTYVVSGKSKLNVCSYGTDPLYGAAYGATEDVNYPDDHAVYDELMNVLQTDRPRLVLACFPSVDLAGHSSVWSSYTSAITAADSLAWKTWNYLQSDSFYTGQTYMFITNDHGRHNDANGGFTNHGDGCAGCRELMFLALGPDIWAGHSSDGYFTQRDICSTVGYLLDFPVPNSQGNLMPDIFTPVSTGIAEPFPDDGAAPPGEGTNTSRRKN